MFLHACYGEVNQLNYSNPYIADRIGRQITIMSKLVRQGKKTHQFRGVGPNIATSVAWVGALANRLCIFIDNDVEGWNWTVRRAEFWYRYPGVCPKCGSSPCACGTGIRKEITPGQRLTRSPSILTVQDYQRMLHGIYPKNTLEETFWHLFEEISELSDSVTNFAATHDKLHLENAKLELMDVLAHLCAAATLTGFDVATELSLLFEGNVCMECHQPKCVCDFTIAKPVVIKR